MSINQKRTLLGHDLCILIMVLIWQGHKDLNCPEDLLPLTFIKQATPLPTNPGTFIHHEFTRSTTPHLPRKGKYKGKLGAV